MDQHLPSSMVISAATGLFKVVPRQLTETHRAICGAKKKGPVAMNDDSTGDETWFQYYGPCSKQ
jgi:hypothetical protein